MEEIQEITPIMNIEEFSLGYVAGYVRRVSEQIILIYEKEITKMDEQEIHEIMMRRIPEIRKELMRYLNK